MRPFQGWHAEMLRLQDLGMSDPFWSCSTEFQVAPLPPFPGPGREGAGRGPEPRADRAWASRPGAEPLLHVPPLHLGLGPGRCYNFLAFSPAVSPQARPTRASLPFPAGVLPASLRGVQLFSGLRAGREAGPGAGGSGGGGRESRGERN